MLAPQPFNPLPNAEISQIENWCQIELEATCSYLKLKVLFLDPLKQPVLAKILNINYLHWCFLEIKGPLGKNSEQTKHWIFIKIIAQRFQHYTGNEVRETLASPKTTPTEKMFMEFPLQQKGALKMFKPNIPGPLAPSQWLLFETDPSTSGLMIVHTCDCKLPNLQSHTKYSGNSRWTLLKPNKFEGIDF